MNINFIYMVFTPSKMDLDEFTLAHKFKIRCLHLHGCDVDERFFTFCMECK